MDPTPPWHRIDTVLLDMDGTLLDRHFDDHFWQEHLPRRYAERFGVPLERAKRHLAARFQAEAGTLNWYCLDYWSRELGLSVALLKEEVAHLVREHPGVFAFLEALGRAGKRRILVTNAHWQVFDLKLARVPLMRALDHVYTTHDLGLPKEDPRLWRRLRTVFPFDPRRTLLLDDSEAVLDSARRYGIAHLYTIARPSSRARPRRRLRYPAVHDFHALARSLTPAQHPGEAAEDEHPEGGGDGEQDGGQGGMVAAQTPTQPGQEHGH